MISRRQAHEQVRDELGEPPHANNVSGRGVILVLPASLLVLLKFLTVVRPVKEVDAHLLLDFHHVLQGELFGLLEVLDKEDLSFLLLTEGE